MALWALLLAAIAASAAAASTAVTPIQKVLQIMQGMKATSAKEKADEQVRFAAFQQFCAGTSAEKEIAIARTRRRIEGLDAEMSQASADIALLRSEIAELEEDVGRWRKDSGNAADVRSKERVDFTATRADYSDSINACTESILVLRGLGKVPQPRALLQVRSSAQNLLRQPRVPEEFGKAFAALLGTDASSASTGVATPGDEFAKAPNAYAYEAQSGGVLKMLADLRERLRGELRDLEKEETAARHGYEVLAQKLTDQTELAQQTIGHRSKTLAEREADTAAAMGQKNEAEALYKQDESYLSDLRVLCKQKSDDFAARQELRAAEIESLEKAIELVSSDAVAADRLPGAPPPATSLAQLRRGGESGNGGNGGGGSGVTLGRVASLLRARGEALRNDRLALLASRAAKEPFAKVKKMIHDLIVKLREEMNEEADHKAWCDTELATNEKTRSAKSSVVDELAAEAERLSAEIARLSQVLTDLADQVAALDTAVAEASAERQKESEENAAATADAKESRTAIAQALAVLREFYAKAGEATALLQQGTRQLPVEDAPETFEGPYKGLQAESGGVIGLLEVIESDFARLEVSTEESERAATEAHRKFLADSAKDKAVANAEIDHETSRQSSAEQSLASTRRSLEQTQSELNAANAYYEKLRPSCVDASTSFDERVKRRNEELESLRDAYRILSGEDVPSLREMKSEQIEAR